MQAEERSREFSPAAGRARVRLKRPLCEVVGSSVAALIRQGVELYLGASRRPDRKEVAERALRAIGRFSSGLSDVSADHDRYLAEAFWK